MAYNDWSVTTGETPSASKWNQLGENDAGFNDVIGANGGGVLKDVKVYTTNSTWTKPSGLRFIEVEVIGGGGAGGGAPTTGASQVGIGTGGGSGGYSYKRILASSLGTSETVTVGAGGLEVIGGNGNNGVASSFGSHCSANGGFGGTANLTNTNGGTYIPGGDGGTATGGDLNIQGGPGGITGTFTLSNNVCYSGFGGTTPRGYGLGGKSISANAFGLQGTGYGAGGSGGALSQFQAQTTGGRGRPGIVIVKEYL